MKTVNEVSKQSGVSVRTLHYYDEIGLLKPAGKTESGYRLYNEESISRLKTVLMFRELGFSLNDIRKILDSPDFNLNTVLSSHIDLLKLQRTHIDGLINEAEKMMKGGMSDDFRAFDRRNMEKIVKEAKEKWGSTAAFRESQEKMRRKNDSEKKDIADGLMKQFALCGKIKDLNPDSVEAQEAVRMLQQYISDNYYTCTKEILAGLGEMYTSDSRFRQNIDDYGGEGTAEFVGKAIRVYCGFDKKK